MSPRVRAHPPSTPRRVRERTPGAWGTCAAREAHAVKVDGVITEPIETPREAFCCLWPTTRRGIKRRFSRSKTSCFIGSFFGVGMKKGKAWKWPERPKRVLPHPWLAQGTREQPPL
jgi:hypothetical protein